MPHPLSHKYPIPISQLCLVNTDVPAGVGAPPLDTTTTGLDYWTHGNCLWGEKGTPMCRAKTPGHKVCSSVVVTHLKVASSLVPSHSAPFLLLLYLDGNLGVATPRPRANKCAWALLVCDAVFQSGWVFFICPYCSPLLSRCFFS